MQERKRFGISTIVMHKQVRIYRQSGNDAGKCSLTRWQQINAWNDVMAAILKLWCQVENPTLLIYAYLHQEHSYKISPHPIWNSGAFGFLSER